MKILKAWLLGIAMIIAVVSISQSVSAEEEANDYKMVLKVQRILNEISDAKLDTDGIFGPKTEEALRGFMHDNGIEGEATITENLILKLMRYRTQIMSSARETFASEPEMYVVNNLAITYNDIAKYPIIEDEIIELIYQDLAYSSKTFSIDEKNYISIYGSYKTGRTYLVETRGEKSFDMARDMICALGEDITDEELLQIMEEYKNHEFQDVQYGNLLIRITERSALICTDDLYWQ